MGLICITCDSPFDLDIAVHRKPYPRHSRMAIHYQMAGVLLLAVAVSCASLLPPGDPSADSDLQGPQSKTFGFFAFLFGWPEPMVEPVATLLPTVPVYGQPFFYYSPTFGFSVDPYFDSYDFANGFISSYDQHEYMPFDPAYDYIHEHHFG